MENHELEGLITAIEAHEKFILQWRTKTYAYNSMAQNRVLGERPTKYVFQKS